MKILKFTFKFMVNFITFIFISLAVISLIYFINSTKQKDYITGIGKLKFLSVLSGSMSPTFNTYDMIIDISTKESNIKVGDVITFWKGNNLVTHRVEGIANKNGTIYFKTKGDANSVEDLEEVSAQEVVGRYIFRIPYLGLIMAKLREELGVYVISIIAFYIILSEVLRSIKAGRKKTYPMRKFKKMDNGKSFRKIE